ncbi:MAG: PEGA domain-containing protein, partial [Deltaproteobacteria bacterium]|nr:PEGA domain-containing protein [Deltaproteobacteria bacterium]
TPIAAAAPALAPFARVNLPPPTESVRFSIPAPPRRRSRALFIGLVAAAVIGAGIAVLALAPGPSDVSAAPGSAAAAPPTAPPPPAKKAAAIAPTTPPAPKTVRLRVTSEPSGATVVLDGERLGTTPFDATVPARTQPATLKVRMQGRIAKKTQVSLDTDVTWDVALHHLQ